MKLDLKGLIISLFIYLFTLWIQYFNLTPLVLLISFLALGVILVNPQRGAYLSIIILFLFDDLPYDLDLQESFSSIHTTQIFGQTIFKIFLIVSLVVIILNLMKNYKKYYFKITFVRIMLILGLMAGVVGLINGNILNFSEYINDLRFFINFFIGFFFVTLFTFKNGLYKRILPALSGIFIIKVISILILTISLSKSSLVYKITTDTGFYLMIFFLLYFFVLIKYYPKNKWISYSGILSVIMALVLSASRGRIVIVSFALLMFLVATKNTRVIPKIAVAFILVLGFIPVISPEMYNYFLWKLSSFNPQEGAGESALVRYIEFVNILGINLNSYHSFITGSGLGGFWTSQFMSYPFSLYDTSSYPDEWIRTDKFFKPHGIIQFLLLKVGVIGTLLFYGSLTKLFVRTKKFVQRFSLQGFDATILIALSSGFIPFYLSAFSSKLQFFGGVFLGLWFCYNQNLILNESNNSG